MTVSCRRSAEDGVTIASDGARPVASTLPQYTQNLPSGGLQWPHDEQAEGSGAPHWLQNLLPSGISALQLGQTMPHLVSLQPANESLMRFRWLSFRLKALTFGKYHGGEDGS